MKTRSINLNLVDRITSLKRKKIFFASLFLVSCFISTSAQIKLSFNPQKGVKYEHQMGTIQNMKQSVMGQEIPMEMEMNGTYIMEIMDKSAHEIHAQMTFQGFAFNVSSPMMKIRYDSENPTENPSEMDKVFEKMFNTLIGKTFSLIFAADGSVKSAAGMGDIIENMLEAISSNGQVAEQMRVQMNQQFSDETMKRMFEQSFNFYPENEIKVGDSWNIEMTAPMNNMNFAIKTRNTLKELTNNMASIEVSGDIEMDMGEMGEGKLTGTQTGIMTIDTTTGMPVTSEISQNMKGSIKAQGMEIQMEIASKIKMSTKEIR